MQSAAMGYALSTKHFADVLVAVPSSVSIVFMVRSLSAFPGEVAGGVSGAGGMAACSSMSSTAQLAPRRPPPIHPHCLQVWLGAALAVVWRMIPIKDQR